MEQSMESFEKELNQSFRKMDVDDIVKGTVIAITEKAIFVDLQYYAQGIIPAEEITDDATYVVEEHFQVGDEIQATIISKDDGEGNLVLSLKEANEVLSWDILKEYKESQKEITVKISESVKAGVICYVEGIRGFIPASQLSTSYVENTEEWLHKEVDVVVITVDQANNKLVLSAKEVMKKREHDAIAEKKAKLVPGSVFEGTVETIMPYGAFINLGEGLSGLLHISRISQKRLKSPSEVLKEGQKVKVKLIDVKDGKLSLSMKEFEGTMDVETDSLDTYDYKEEGEATTTLGDLLAKLKL